MMALPRPDEVSRQDVESLVRDIMRQRPVTRSPFVTSSPEGDLPPKYEELGIDLPPEYDESTMAVNLNQETEEPAPSEPHPTNCDSSEIHPTNVDNDDDSDKNDDESGLKCPSNTEESNSQYSGIQSSIETKQPTRQ